VILHEIDTGTAKPHKEATRRHPYALQEKIKTQVDDMLEAGIIIPSKSEWFSAIVPVLKDDKSVRVCIDYRNLS
jgi:tRNA A37 N6-isopentenylltransferase MiaA